MAIAKVIKDFPKHAHEAPIVFNALRRQMMQSEDKAVKKVGNIIKKGFRKVKDLKIGIGYGKSKYRLSDTGVMKT